MSKMKMPEMSVVRFTESDVIVASAVGRQVYLSKWGDSNRFNATIRLDSESGTLLYEHTETGRGTDIMSQYFSGSYVFHENMADPHATQWSDLLYLDNDDGRTNDKIDGLYTYQGNGVFNHQ